VAHEREGILYDAAAPGALADSLERLGEPSVRQRMSAAARERAVRDYSWSVHCQALVAAIAGAAQRRSRAAQS
jgi:glycosyltransferase involved in cell wall biosynthesis